MQDLRKYLAEMIGTFALVFIGCGSVVIAKQHIGYAGIAAAFGLTVLAMVYAIGPISGCHINPAITCSMLAAGKIKPGQALFYVVFQCVGAVIASAVLLVVASGKVGYELATNGLGQNGYGAHSPDGYSMATVFLAEAVLTMLFLLAIFGATSKKASPGFAGVAIGLTLVFIHLVGIPISGTSVNPARSFGPAVLVGGDALSQLWLFWVAPILGGIVAALIWRICFEPKQESSPG
jgi:aquaporin Z